MAEMMDRKKLIEYLPDFMQKFSEIKELMRVSNIESDRIYPLIGKCLDEAFIEDCSEYGIRKYESCLHIIPDESETLETRKLHVMMRWYDNAPYTFRVLINKLNMICGVNNYDIDSDLENYSISISIYGKPNTLEIEQYIDSILPQNITHDIRSSIGSVILANIGTIWQDDEIFSLKEATL